ncbi:MAG: tRNA (N(6)-L-threonylcarbamoyladenosine(37)-C(2))-methylthiotransferase MtaB [Proteobacteria bacterium]|nr:tRNA (N(6)-L-threonylcarbamoyladenosine(37)-C(2))-methylthiotransferase MtaB [Pseudomonadota bacterium]MBU1716816.1 tRNA (N(6)-L-threonylcarbamoyladenosine(37)-C(2))-methylthiotransferase MtaB [Pseudomonadota bacterium]
MAAKKNQKKRVAITTLGCKVNQFESASFLSVLEEKGAEVVPFSGVADVYIINTCAVTAKAGSQSRHVIRRALRNNPNGRLVVTGCYAQVAAQDILEIVDQPICIVGNNYKHLLADIALSDKHCDLEMYLGDTGRQDEICPLPVKRFAGRTRAYLKIQDGCNRFCSYCIVPYARGRSCSLAPEQVLEQVGVFITEGYKEMVVTGIHTGVYGHDLEPPTTLTDLIRLILAENHPIRYRISSLEPAEINDELLELMATSGNLMPHLHIPLQSGDDDILKRMNRRYPAATFADIVEQSVRLVPQMAIGVDVLVGFPGEDEQAFQNTYKLLERLPITYLHVFPYSKRPGTLAANMSGQLPKQTKEERVALLRELDHKKRVAFYSKHLGEVHLVLAEIGRKKKFRMMKGFTENYIPVYFEAPESVGNQIVKVRLDRLEGATVFGRLLA